MRLCGSPGHRGLAPFQGTLSWSKWDVHLGSLKLGYYTHVNCGTKQLKPSTLLGTQWRYKGDIMDIYIYPLVI